MNDGQIYVKIDENDDQYSSLLENQLNSSEEYVIQIIKKENEFDYNFSNLPRIRDSFCPIQTSNQLEDYLNSFTNLSSSSPFSPSPFEIPLSNCYNSFQLDPSLNPFLHHNKFLISRQFLENLFNILHLENLFKQKKENITFKPENEVRNPSLVATPILFKSIEGDKKKKFYFHPNLQPIKKIVETKNYFLLFFERGDHNLHHFIKQSFFFDQEKEQRMTNLKIRREFLKEERTKEEIIESFHREKHKDHHLFFSYSSQQEDLERLFIIYQLLNCILFLHSKGILIGNLNTKNILISPHKWIKLTNLIAPSFPKQPKNSFSNKQVILRWVNGGNLFKKKKN